MFDKKRIYAKRALAILQRTRQNVYLFKQVVFLKCNTINRLYFFREYKSRCFTAVQSLAPYGVDETVCNNFSLRY